MRGPQGVKCVWSVSQNSLFCQQKHILLWKSTLGQDLLIRVGFYLNIRCISIYRLLLKFTGPWRGPHWVKWDWSDTQSSSFWPQKHIPVENSTLQQILLNKVANDIHSSDIYNKTSKNMIAPYAYRRGPLVYLLKQKVNIFWSLTTSISKIFQNFHKQKFFTSYGTLMGAASGG